MQTRRRFFNHWRLLYVNVLIADSQKRETFSLKHLEVLRGDGKIHPLEST